MSRLWLCIKLSTVESTKQWGNVTCAESKTWLLSGFQLYLYRFMTFPTEVHTRSLQIPVTHIFRVHAGSQPVSTCTPSLITWFWYQFAPQPVVRIAIVPPDNVAVLLVRRKEEKKYGVGNRHGYHEVQLAFQTPSPPCLDHIQPLPEGSNLRVSDSDLHPTQIQDPLAHVQSSLNQVPDMAPVVQLPITWSPAFWLCYWDL